jgi:hypothetical protein
VSAFLWHAVALRLADLSVSLGDSPDPVSLGDTGTYTATVTNSGAVDAINASASLSLSGPSADPTDHGVCPPPDVGEHTPGSPGTALLARLVLEWCSRWGASRRPPARRKMFPLQRSRRTDSCAHVLCGGGRSARAPNGQIFR